MLFFRACSLQVFGKQFLLIWGLPPGARRAGVSVPWCCMAERHGSAIPSWQIGITSRSILGRKFCSYIQRWGIDVCRKHIADTGKY